MSRFNTITILPSDCFGRVKPSVGRWFVLGPLPTAHLILFILRVSVLKLLFLSAPLAAVTNRKACRSDFDDGL
jgi:hypothetical protein